MEKRQKRHRSHASYYEYVTNIVDKCGHKYLVLQSKNFRDFKISYNSNNDLKVPGGVHYKITPAKCKSYSCPICGKKKVLDLMKRLKGIDLKHYRFFTLTLKNKYNFDNTVENLNNVSKYFNELNKRLRKRKEFKGLEYFRVTEIGKDGMIHIHGIWNKYVPSAFLSEMWHDITKESFITKVERIKNKADAVNYLYKYLSKDVVSKNRNTDPNFFVIDKTNSAGLFYETGKRRYQTSRKFFPVKEEKNSDFVPYYFEQSDTKTVESFIQARVNEFGLTKENFDLTYYFESDLFLDELFKPKNKKPPG